MANSTNARMLAKFPVPMRASPTITFNDLVVDAEVAGSVEAISSVANTYFDPMYGGRLSLNCSSSSVGTGASVMLYPNSTSGYLQGDCELWITLTKNVLLIRNFCLYLFALQTMLSKSLGEQKTIPLKKEK